MSEFPRTNVHGGAAFEDVAGYSRIVIAGPFAYVSGTTAVTPGVHLAWHPGSQPSVSDG